MGGKLTPRPINSAMKTPWKCAPRSHACFRTPFAREILASALILKEFIKINRAGGGAGAY